MPSGLLQDVAREAAKCRACDLWKCGTQTVFGAGPEAARMVLVGEQPGDKEDLAGEPFVGPAGQLLDRAIDDAGLARQELYVTNAVKHFKWTPRGKRRIHEKPNRVEIVACHQWLERELEIIEPEVIVALGATAGQSLLGPAFRVGAAKGRILELEGVAVVGTVHPSAILRRRGHERDDAFSGLVEDLRLAAGVLSSGGRGRSHRRSG